VPPTLRELCNRLGPDLVPFGDSVDLTATVTAVHVSELPNPADYLEGGELLLTTGLRVPRTVAGCAKYVERLLSAGVVGLGFGLGPVHDETPQVLADTAGDAGLPLLCVPRPTPFVRISRTFWQLVAAEEQRQASAVLGAHRDLVAATLAKQPSQGVLRRLAKETGGWAAHLSVDGIVQNVWPAEAEALTARLDVEVQRLRGGGLHAAATFELEGYDVAIQPVTGRDRLYGFLAAGSRGATDQRHRHLMLLATALLALDSERTRQLRSARRREHRAVLTLLRKDLHAAGRTLACELGVPFPTGTVRCGLIACDDPNQVLDLLEEHTGRRRRIVLSAVLDDKAFLVLPDDQQAVDWLGRQMALLDGATGAVTGPTTLDRLVEDLSRLTRAVQEPAQTKTSTLQDLADPAGSLVDRLSDRTVRDWARAALVPLTRGRSDLVPTLAAYLKHNCEYEGAARELGVHRHTMRSRLQRITELLDRNLDDPETRAELWMALRLLGHV
jgi:purine catabolism regulator